MVLEPSMNKLMQNHVVHQSFRQADNLHIQADVVSVRATAPSRLLIPNEYSVEGESMFPCQVFEPSG